MMRNSALYIMIALFVFMSCRSSDTVASLDLLNNSHEYTVKIKNKNIEFGPYYTLKSRRKKFKAAGTSILGITATEEQKVRRFELNKEQTKRSEIIMIEKVEAEELTEVKEYPLEFKGNNLMIATIRPLGSLEQWELVVQNVYKDLPITGETKGVLTNGKQTIHIKGVKLDEHPLAQKKSGLVDGYYFEMEEKTIGAVQTYHRKAKERTVWVRRDLPEDLQLILSGASSALMLKGKAFDK